MFTGEMAESRQTEVTIRDVEESAMETLVDFCYNSYIVVEETNVQTLLPAACLLQLQEIQDVCCEFLKRQLDPSNCLGIRAFADTHACRDLLKKADAFTQHHFQEVVDHEEFLLLPLNQLMEISSSDELNVRSEEQVYQAVMSWVKYNISERRQHLPVVWSKIERVINLCVSRPNFLSLGAATRPIAITLPQISRRYRERGSPHQIRRVVPRPGGRGEELPAAAARAPAHAGTEDEASEAHPEGRGPVCR